jgi:hypothetical protein
VRKVLQAVMSLWLEALVREDFRRFQSSLSQSWRSQDSPEKLLSSYRPLAVHREALSLFPDRGKLVLLESGPFKEEERADAQRPRSLRDTLGPESPWLVRGEWRTGKTALHFTLILSLEGGQWRPSGLRVEMYR